MPRREGWAFRWYMSGHADIVTQFDSISVNVVQVQQQQVIERPRRFNDRPPRP